MVRSLPVRVNGMTAFMQSLQVAVDHNPHGTLCRLRHETAVAEAAGAGPLPLPPPAVAAAVSNSSSIMAPPRRPAPSATAATSTASIPPPHQEDCGCVAHPFFSHSPPRTAFSEYVRRLIKYLKFDTDEDTFYIIALAYARRAQRLHLAATQEPLITQFSAHRVFLACCVMAAKFHSEKPQHNKTYADIGGVRPSDILDMELALLQLLECSLFLETEEYHEVESLAFHQGAATTGGLRRNSSGASLPSRVASTDNILSGLSTPTPSPFTSLLGGSSLRRCPSLFRLSESPVPRPPTFDGDIDDEGVDENGNPRGENNDNGGFVAVAPQLSGREEYTFFSAAAGDAGSVSESDTATMSVTPPTTNAIGTGRESASPEPISPLPL